MIVVADTGFSLNEIAARLGGDVLGDGETRVSQVASISSAVAGQIAFLAQAKYSVQLDATKASAVIVPRAFADATSLPRIVTDNPYAYFARLSNVLNPAAANATGQHSSVVSASRVLASVFLDAGVCVGKDVELGEAVRIYANCSIGDGVHIGSGSVIYPNVTIYPGCQVGRNAIIHSGAVIGSDGFGFAPDGDEWVKIHHSGRVRIGNDVEIGANTTIDRGALEDTVVEDGCKLDNQIHIAHNCVIGANTVIAGCVGIAGSARIGRRCMLGGAAMILGHLEIVDGTTISPGTMVMKSIRKPGKYTGLYPAEEHERWLKNAAQVRQLSKLSSRVEDLEKLVKQLTSNG